MIKWTFGKNRDKEVQKSPVNYCRWFARQEWSKYYKELLEAAKARIEKARIESFDKRRKNTTNKRERREQRRECLINELLAVKKWQRIDDNGHVWVGNHQLLDRIEIDDTCPF